MKTRFLKDGTLIIQSESGTESYALLVWLESWRRKDGGASLKIDADHQRFTDSSQDIHEVEPDV